ncbi:MAG TPA: AAA family ATPase [Frateuria sp.]|uniref:AAA family ATPase n=1 Tax=Frateuria sp. TaxID=2211372 RepID=UPI002D809BC6|nr:AAA family ATPase [Frateuria sp.]HET6807226.1 AAA family ATPase [Frateuria sp.]
MNKSVIVFGPPGCGKTRAAQRIAKHFGLSRIVDGWDGRERPQLIGTLYLTNQVPPEFHDGRRAYAFESLPKSVRG